MLFMLAATPLVFYWTVFECYKGGVLHTREDLQLKKYLSHHQHVCFYYAVIQMKE